MHYTFGLGCCLRRRSYKILFRRNFTAEVMAACRTFTWPRHVRGEKKQQSFRTDVAAAAAAKADGNRENKRETNRRRHRSGCVFSFLLYLFFFVFMLVPIITYLSLSRPAHGRGVTLFNSFVLHRRRSRTGDALDPCARTLWSAILKKINNNEKRLRDRSDRVNRNSGRYRAPRCRRDGEKNGLASRKFFDTSA